MVNYRFLSICRFRRSKEGFKLLFKCLLIRFKSCKYNKIKYNKIIPLILVALIVFDSPFPLCCPHSPGDAVLSRMASWPLMPLLSCTPFLYGCDRDITLDPLRHFERPFPAKSERSDSSGALFSERSAPIGALYVLRSAPIGALYFFRSAPLLVERSGIALYSSWSALP